MKTQYSPLWLVIIIPVAIIVAAATVWAVNNAEHIGHLPY